MHAYSYFDGLKKYEQERRQDGFADPLSVAWVEDMCNWEFLSQEKAEARIRSSQRDAPSQQD